MISLILALFSVCLMAIMYTVLKSERKQSHCFALEILSDEFCAARTISSSYSFVFGCILTILSFITSILWLSLQEKQRKFAQHWYEHVSTTHHSMTKQKKKRHTETKVMSCPGASVFSTNKILIEFLLWLDERRLQTVRVDGFFVH